MEPFKDEQSSDPVSGDSQASEYTDGRSNLLKRKCGVDSRDVVKRQARELASSECITVECSDDSDDEQPLSENLQPNYEDNCHPRSSDIDCVIVEEPLGSSILPEPSHMAIGSGVWNDSKKKNLFGTSRTVHQIAQSSGLLSPPQSGETSPQSNFYDETRSETPYPYSFSTVVSQEEADSSDDTSIETYSSRYAHLLTDSISNDSQYRSTLDPIPVINASQEVRATLEAKGIERSQYLRARRGPFRTCQSRRQSTLSPKLSLAATAPSRESPDVQEVRDVRSATLGIQSATQDIEVNHTQLSRKAANATKAQSRHLDSINHQKCLSETSNELEQKAHDRLLRIKSNARGHSRILNQRAKANTQASIPSVKYGKFHAPEFATRSRNPSYPAKPKSMYSQAEIRELMGVSTTRSLPADHGQNSETGQVAENIGITGTSATTRPTTTLSILEQLGMQSNLRPEVKKQFDSKPSDSYRDLPEVGTDVPLPQCSFSWSEERKQHYRTREGMKGRGKDLHLVLDCFKVFAQLLAVACTTDKDVGQLRELRDLTEAVLFRNRSGRQVRSRFRAIRDRVQRCADSMKEVPCPKAVDEKLKDIMPQPSVEKWQTEMLNVKRGLQQAQALCRKDYMIGSNVQKKKRRTRAILSSANSKRGNLGLFHRLPTHSVDQRIKATKERLETFEDLNTTSSPNLKHHEVQEVKLPTVDLDGDTSEEDEGEDIALPHHFKTDRDVHEASSLRISTEPQSLPTETVRESRLRKHAQAANQSILDAMIIKEQQRLHMDNQGTQRPHDRISSSSDQVEDQQSELFLVDNEPEIAFDDSDIDYESESNELEEVDEDEQPICKRYIVKTVVSGLGAVYSLDEHILGRYLQWRKATAKVHQVTPFFRQAVAKTIPSDSPHSFTITLKDSEPDFELLVTLGADGGVGCRTWIEQELYNPSKEAYENAKVKRACKPPDIWYVDWEKVITPVVSTLNHEEDYNDMGKIANAGPVNDRPSSAQQTNISTGIPSSQDTVLVHDNYCEDLFESNSPPSDPVLESTSTPLPSSKPETILPTTSNPDTLAKIERPNLDSLRVYTSIAEANRQAKNVFMIWFISHLPGPGNFDYIKHEDEAIEEQLKYIGDRDLWTREEEFEIDTKEGRVTEKYRVWVGKAKGYGWRN